MNDLLFDTPIWLLLTLFAAGISLWWAGNNRLDRQLKRVGFAVFLCGAGLAVLSFLVDTDKEMAVRYTRRLVTAINKRDWSTFEVTLDPQTSMEWFHGRDELVAGAKKTADEIGLKSVRILSMNVQQKDSVITIDLGAISEQDRTLGRPVITNWEFNWQNLGTGWVLQTISPLPSAQVKPDDIKRNLAH